MNNLENLSKAEFLESPQGESTLQNTKYSCFGDEGCFCNDEKANKYIGLASEEKNKVYEMK